MRLPDAAQVGRIKIAFCRSSQLIAPIFNKVTSLLIAPKTQTPQISWNEFEERLSPHLKENKIDGLLEIESKAEFKNDFPVDLTLYGLPRLLLCESDEIAQMLRANQFHLQTPCGVLSVHEATPLSEVCQKMLSLAEDPQIFFLHNANLAAFSLIKNLRQTLQIAENISLRPIGLRPVHAQRLQLFANKTKSNDFDFSGFTYLSDKEKKWLLQGNSAEVTAISPVRLLRALRRIILGLEIPPSNWPLKLPKKELGFI